MKFYRKQPIEAEQFDGSNEMVDKYELIDAGTMLGTHHSPELYLTGSGKVDVGDWIITDNFNHHTLMTDEEFKQTYAELPVIPQAVAKYIEMTRDEVMLFDALDAVLSGFGTLPDWISSNQDLFARAWLDGYQVEKDK